MSTADPRDAFIKRFLEEAPALVDLVRAASEIPEIANNPDLPGNGEDMLNDWQNQAQLALDATREQGGGCG